MSESSLVSTRMGDDLLPDFLAWAATFFLHPTIGGVDDGSLIDDFFDFLDNALDFCYTLK